MTDMDADDKRDEDTADDQPVVPARPSWRAYIKQIIYAIIVAALCLLAASDLPTSQTYNSLMDNWTGAQNTATSPGTLEDSWKPVGNYVVEESMTDAMTGVERLRHENEQRALLAPKEVVPPPNVRIPLLPGRVEKKEKPVDVRPSTAAGMAPIPVQPKAEGDTSQPAQQTAQENKTPEKPDPFAEDMATLNALREALKELKAEKAVQDPQPYRNDISDK